MMTANINFCDSKIFILNTNLRKLVRSTCVKGHSEVDMTNGRIIEPRKTQTVQENKCKIICWQEQTKRPCSMNYEISLFFWFTLLDITVKISPRQTGSDSPPSTSLHHNSEHDLLQPLLGFDSIIYPSNNGELDPLFHKN